MGGSYPIYCSFYNPCWEGREAEVCMSQEKTFSIGQRLIVDHRFKSRRKFAGCDSSVWVSALGIVGGVGEHGLLKLVGLCMTGNPSLVMPQVFQGTREGDEEEYCQYDFV